MGRLLGIPMVKIKIFLFFVLQCFIQSVANKNNKND